MRAASWSAASHDLSCSGASLTAGRAVECIGENETLHNPTNQAPIDLTVGTSTDASDAFAGDFGQLLVGVRSQLAVQVLLERYADNGQIGIVVHYRGDVAVARSAAFHVVTGIVPA